MNGTLAYAFIAGTVATINPCGFALLPAYLSYYLGLDDSGSGDGRPVSTGSDGSAPGGASGSGDGPTVGAGPVSSGSSTANPVLKAIGVSLAVTLGFVAVFGIMGVAWSSVSGWLGTRLPYFTMVIGILLVALGVAMLRGFEPVLNLPRMQLSHHSRQLSSMFLYGVSYAIASLSCTIGVFIAVTSTTLTESSFLGGVATFIAYGLGMGATLAVLTIAVALAKAGIVARFASLLPKMNAISGVLLILAGAFVAYYAYVEIQELAGNGSSGVVRWVRGIQSSAQRWAEQMGATRLLVGAAVIIAGSLTLTWVLRRSRVARPEPPDHLDDDHPTPVDLDQNPA